MRKPKHNNMENNEFIKIMKNISNDWDQLKAAIDQDMTKNEIIYYRNLIIWDFYDLQEFYHRISTYSEDPYLEKKKLI